MKIYAQDCDWAGSIVVIANSEKEAREMMKDELNYDKFMPVEEHEIKHGFLFSNYGDM